MLIIWQNIMSCIFFQNKTIIVEFNTIDNNMKQYTG